MTFPMEQHEWLETDGLGGFASGTTVGIRIRRYHALLLVATTPPTGRVLLVNGFEAWVETPAGSFALTSRVYAPNVVHPDGARRMVAFVAEPWPHWEFLLEDGTYLEHDLFVRHGISLGHLLPVVQHHKEGATLMRAAWISAQADLCGALYWRVSKHHRKLFPQEQAGAMQARLDGRDT